jgi:DNA-binding MurR/RpiR family transcriptional regulator
MANFLGDNWQLAGRMGASIGASLTDIDARDALIVVTKPPFARSSIRAAEMAQSQGAFVVVITDSHACPALRFASSGFLVPAESPNFFSSYVATLFLIETIVALVAARAGPSAMRHIADVEKRIRDLEEVIDS